MFKKFILIIVSCLMAFNVFGQTSKDSYLGGTFNLIHSSVNYRKLLQFTFLSCFNLPLLFRGSNAALSSIVGQSASVYSGELNPIIL